MLAKTTFGNAVFLATAVALGCAAMSPAQQVTIESPSSGTVFNAGQTISVNVSVTGGPVLAVEVLAQSMGGSLTQTAPYSFSITVPSGVIGVKNLVATGVLAPNEALISPVVTVDIEPASPPTAMAYLQSGATFHYAGQQRRIGIMATFADGSTEDVSNSTQLTYSSDTPSVVTVDNTGLMTAQGPGTANVTATYGTVTAVLPVVGTSGVTGDLNADGVVTEDDVAILESALGSTPNGPNDGRNLDGDATIDAGDVTALLALCGSACPPQVATTTLLSSPGAQIPFGQPLTLTAGVTNATSTALQGTVIFIVDGQRALSALLTSSETASETLISLAAGSHTIQAEYSGNATDAPSMSEPATIQVLAPVMASIAVVPASLAIAPGATDQFTAYSVFSDGSVQNATGAVWASQTPAVATIDASTGLATAVSPGTAQITATVGTIASPPVSLTVTAITPTVTVSLSPTSITAAQSTMVTVTVSGGTGNPTPTGSVTLTSGTYTSAATSLTSGSAVITVPGSSLAVATDTLTATYTPDSTSASIYNSAMGTNTVTVTAAASFALSNSGNISFEASATAGNTATITVTPSNGFTGAVALTCADTMTPTNPTSPATCAVTPSVTISGASAQNATLTVNTTATTTAGAYAVTVTGVSGSISMPTTVDATVTAYVPPPTFSLSNNGPISFEASASTGNTATISVTPANGFTGAVNLTCAVTTTPANPTSPATCGVTPSVTITGAASQNATLTVTTTTTTTAGAYAVTVTGSSGAISAPTTVTANVTAYVAPSFALTNSGNITVVPGATTGNTATITVTPSGGFTGNVTLTAAVTTSPKGATELPTFSFGTTSPVDITGATAGTGTITVFTTPATTGALVRPNTRGTPWYVAGGTTMACLLLFGIPARRRRWRAMLGIIALFALLAGGLVSCISGSSGTTTGTYTITVTGTSGSITQTTTVTVIVN